MGSYSQSVFYIPWAAGTLSSPPLITFKSIVITNTCKYDLIQHLNIKIYYGFSLLHKFSLVVQPWMSAYIRKTDGVYISVSYNDNNMDYKTIMLHCINRIIRNDKCIFTKLNAVFKLKTAVWTKKILQQIILSQIPDRFSKLICSTAVP